MKVGNAEGTKGEQRVEDGTSDERVSISLRSIKQIKRL